MHPPPTRGLISVMARPFPVLPLLLGAGAVALAYVGMSSRRPTAPGPVAPSQPTGSGPPVGTSSPGGSADRDAVRARYQEYQMQLGFPDGLNAYRGNPGVLRTLASDLDRVGLPIAASDVRRSLQQIS